MQSQLKLGLRSESLGFKFRIVIGGTFGVSSGHEAPIWGHGHRKNGIEAGQKVVTMMPIDTAGITQGCGNGNERHLPQRHQKALRQKRQPRRDVDDEPSIITTTRRSMRRHSCSKDFAQMPEGAMTETHQGRLRLNTALACHGVSYLDLQEHSGTDFPTWAFPIVSACRPPSRNLADCSMS